MLKEGQKAPDFTINDENEKPIALADYKDKWVVLYFYPKDNTPGCTIEALDFTRLKSQFEAQNAVILGMSKDNCKSHQNFINKQKLNIKLLSDPDSAVQKLYGVWRPKKFMGREFLGTVRSSFLINPKGEITKIWDNCQAKGHAEAVLKVLQELNS